MLIICPRCNGTGTVEQSPADQIKARRLALGWSQSKLADCSGVSRTMISMIEGGRANPSTETITRLLKPLAGELRVVFLNEEPTREP